jgi:hypothetical protein
MKKSYGETVDQIKAKRAKVAEFKKPKEEMIYNAFDTTDDDLNEIMDASDIFIEGEDRYE